MEREGVDKNEKKEDEDKNKSVAFKASSSSKNKDKSKKESSDDEDASSIDDEAMSLSSQISKIHEEEGQWCKKEKGFGNGFIDKWSSTRENRKVP